jgi:hypothetical protein
MDYERIRNLFEARFPTGGFSSCDFYPHFNGFGHNAWVAIEPLESAEATCVLAYAKLEEMCEFLRSLRELFGGHDRIQFAVGFPESVKPVSRRIFKGWIPAIRLADVRPPDFAAVGGGFGENDVWSDGVWAEPGAAPDCGGM